MGEKLTPYGLVVGLIIEPPEEQEAPTEESGKEQEAPTEEVVNESPAEAPKRTRQPKPKE